MEKGAILGWLATIHWRNQDRKIILPNLPALAALTEHSNMRDWSEQCYAEMDYLGSMTGFTFKEYLLAFDNPISRAGTVAAHPINIVEDEDSDSEYFTPPSRATRLRMRAAAVGKVIREDCVLSLLSDDNDEVTSGAPVQRGHGVPSSPTSYRTAQSTPAWSSAEDTTNSVCSTCISDDGTSSTESGSFTSAATTLGACSIEIGSDFPAAE